MELIKLKRPIKKVKKKFSEEGLKRRKVSSRNQMILNNPMKNEKSKAKLSMKKKGITTSPGTLFKQGNQYGKLRKNTKVSNAQKMKRSIKMIGKACSEKAKEVNKKRLLKNNPMKNPEIVKKNVASRKRNRKIAANQKRRIASLTNPNVKKTWFKKKENKK